MPALTEMKRKEYLEILSYRVVGICEVQKNGRAEESVVGLLNDIDMWCSTVGGLKNCI